MEIVKEIKRLKEIIDSAKSIVFLGGAGVSCESGIPDFRSNLGIYNQKHNINPEKILSHNFFMNQPKIFYDFYKEKFLYLDALPNPGHFYLADLEEIGKLNTVITQNIDGLHQKAGSVNVIELHGNVYRNKCVKCSKEFDIDYIIKQANPVRCDECNGLVKPEVVLYNETLEEDNVINAVNSIIEADLLIIAGTSLNVYPAAELIRFAKKKLLINLSRTSKDIFCDYVYYGKFGEICKEISLKDN